jgi:RNA polymerase sigma factor (TIGR02999 family)
MPLAKLAVIDVADSLTPSALNVRVPPLGVAGGGVAEGEVGPPLLPPPQAIVSATANDATGTVNAPGRDPAIAVLHPLDIHCMSAAARAELLSTHALRETRSQTVMAERDHFTAPQGGWVGLDPMIDREALDRLFSVTYEELRRLAASVRRGDRAASISPTMLVNEAWMKLAASPAFRSTSPLHFKRIAARAMRQVLVEAARRRHAAKRGGDDAMFVTFDESIEQAAQTADSLIALDVALDDLARINPRQAAMVESRYFAGLEVAEVAALLDVSEATIQRDWRAARAWLAAQIERTRLG